VIDALEAHLRTAVATLPAGAAGFSRFERDGTELVVDQLPHGMVTSEVESSTILTQRQDQRTFRVAIELWEIGSRETVAGHLDAFRDLIVGDPRLGGIVDFARVAAREVTDAGSLRGSADRIGGVIVETVETV
jgi:hypothetical protein